MWTVPARKNVRRASDSKHPHRSQHVRFPSLARTNRCERWSLDFRVAIAYTETNGADSRFHGSSRHAGGNEVDGNCCLTRSASRAIPIVGIGRTDETGQGCQPRLEQPCLPRQRLSSCESVCGPVPASVCRYWLFAGRWFAAFQDTPPPPPPPPPPPLFGHCHPRPAESRFRYAKRVTRV
jgi:hypothetical protein